MTFKEILLFLILPMVLIIYLIYTVKYAKKLEKNILFSKRLKILHGILIWLLPFVWILLIKIFTKPTPGSYKVENKKDNDPFFDVYENTK